MRARRTLTRLLAVLTVAALLKACGDAATEPPTNDPPHPETVTVSPAMAGLGALGATVQLTAEVRDQHGQPMAGAAVTWLSSATSVATAGASGLVTAVGDGTATITATAGAASGTATVTVAQEVSTVVVSPATDTLVAGDTLRLAAAATDANDHAVTGAEFSWSSADTAVAVVDSAGLVTAVAAGEVDITATSSGVTGRAVAEAFDANGYPVKDPEFTWSSSDERVAEVDNAGLVTALGKGRAGIAAASAGAAATAVITVLSRTNQKELAALVALYHSTDGPTWSNSANWLTEEPVSSWHGVTTDESGNVTGIYLQENEMKGSLPHELGDLTNLRALSLWGNQLVGSIPSELGSLADLRDLWLTLNNLSGPIPPALGGLSQLEDLLLERNQLSGTIPPELGDLTNLRRLGLSGNQLSGPIPGELGGLANLRRLGLSGNQLSGPIPGELGGLANLQIISLGGNQLVGPMPGELGNLGNLVFLESHNSGLTGPIPPELGNLSNLLDLWLWDNDLSGPVPPELGNLSSLVTLQLQGNELTGPIPRELGNLSELKYLYAQGNHLVDPIPPALGALAALEILQLSGNRIDGEIPREIGLLTALRALDLSDNRITGTIPRELGNLGRVSFLGLYNNRLTGRLPVELAGLSQLRYIYLHNNGLSGSIPLEFTRLYPDWFRWDGTGLCAPRRRAFQDWLEKVPHHVGVTCPPAYREALAAVYESANGSGWTRNTNWLSELPLSAWYGVTMEDSVMTVLALPGNGLMGTLPEEVLDFIGLRGLDVSDNALTGEIPVALDELSELESLNLSRNRFSGPVPRDLGNLRVLKRLDLSYNYLTGSLPGTFTRLGDLKDFSWNASGACAPSASWFRAWLGAIPNHTGGEDCTAPIVWSLPVAHLTQAAQSVDGDVPLIGGRPAMLRVFATADRANDHRPRANVAFYNGGRTVYVADAELVSSSGLPEEFDLGQADKSFQIQIPGDVLRPGVEMVVELDPGDSVTLAEESETRFPAEGRLALDIHDVPPMKLTVVPVLAGASPDSSVLDWTSALGPDHPTIEFVSNILPVQTVALEVREPLTVARAPRASDVGDWLRLLRDIELLRATEGNDGYWYGAVSREGREGVRGIAFIGGRGGGPVSAGIPDSMVLAHELGHNMSLLHAPCGDPPNWDTDYPYRDGSIGVWGYDFRTGKLVPPETADLMSYCNPPWIGDYGFANALRYRTSTESAAPALTVASEARAKRLLLWGSRSPTGKLTLDPALVIDAPAKLPTEAGPYHIAGFDTSGATSFAFGFDLDALSEAGGSFLFMIPFNEGWLESLNRIVLTGPDGGEATLDGESNAPMAIVVESATGHIRSIMRGEAAEMFINGLERATGGALAAGSVFGVDARVLVSDGLPRRPSSGVR